MTKRALTATWIATLAIITALTGCGDDADDGGGGASGTAAGTGGGSSGQGGASGHSGTGGASGESGEGGTSGEGGASGEGGMGGAGGTGGTGGGNDDETPIAQRESDGTFTCEVSEELVNLKPKVWGYSGGDLVTTSAGDTWVVRTEGESEEPLGVVTYELVASKIDASGAIAAGTIIPVDDASLVTSPRAVALADGAVGVLWLEGTELRMAVLNADGEITTDPKAVATGATLMDAAALRVLRNEDGAIAAVWSNNFDYRSYIAITDAEGAEATPKAFAEGMMGVQLANAEDGAYVALWRSYDPNFMEPSNVFVSNVDETGTVVGEPAQLTDLDAPGGGASFGGGELALTALDGGGYLAAWAVGDWGDMETSTGAYSVVYAQRLAPSGEPDGTPVLFDEKVLEVDQVEPSFAHWGSSIALFWARGSHIYFCAGCIPDHSVSVVLIDPATLDPRSNVVTIDPPETGGLLQRHVAAAGEDTLLMTVGIQFHVHSEPGLAALQCVGE